MRSINCKHPYESCVWMSDDDENIVCQDCGASGIKPSGFSVLDELTNERDELRTRIKELESEREDLLERVLSKDIWLSFEGKDWVMVEAVTKTMLGEGE